LSFCDHVDFSIARVLNSALKNSDRAKEMVSLVNKAFTFASDAKSQYRLHELKEMIAMSAMLRIAALATGLMLSGGIALAQPAQQAPIAEKPAVTETSKHHTSRRDNRRYRQRHHRQRAHHNRRDRRADRYHHRNYERQAPRVRRAAARCWREERFGHFRRSPALVSVRVCRDRRGRITEQRGTARLVYYIDRRQNRRHHRRY
jgi:hypothetical protein